MAWQDRASFQHLGLACWPGPAPSPGSMLLRPPGACSLLSLAPGGSSPSEWGETGSLSQLWMQPVLLPSHLVLGPFCLLWAARQKAIFLQKIAMAGILLFPPTLNASAGVQG